MPKALTPLSAAQCSGDPMKAQAFQRFVGWTWVLTGLRHLSTRSYVVTRYGSYSDKERPPEYASRLTHADGLPFTAGWTTAVTVSPGVPAS